MAKLRAAVLAAGRGVRMGGEQPKTLIEVDGKEPLLYYILNGLKRSGITDVLIITGFAPTAVQEFVERNSEGLDVSFVRNARFASWGNFHSVRVAIDESPGFDLLIVNSDVVVHPDVYRRVADTDGDLVLAVQRREYLLEEDMRVRLDGTRVLDISKNLKMVHSHGEYAGVSLLRPPAARAYVEVATELQWRFDTHGYYEDVYARILPGIDARAALVESGAYAEVDVPDDLKAAAAVIERLGDTWAVS